MSPDEIVAWLREMTASADRQAKALVGSPNESLYAGRAERFRATADTIAALTRERDEAREEAEESHRAAAHRLEQAAAFATRATQAEAERDRLAAITPACPNCSGTGRDAHRTRPHGTPALPCARCEAGREIERMVSEVAEAKGLLEEAHPFIGWASKPAGLLPRIDAFLGRRAGEKQS